MVDMRRRLAGCLLLGVLALAGSVGLAETEKPGVERWAVKVGADADRAEVQPAHNNPVGELAKLVAISRPAGLEGRGETHRVGSVERRIYTVRATVKQFKIEQDGDYHLVLSDGGQTMIAEIPDPPFCGGSRWIPEITATRKAFDARYKVTGRFRYVNARAEVTGIGFFDSPHRQTGVARNAIELHPVLGIRWLDKGAPAATEGPVHPAVRGVKHRRRHGTTRVGSSAAGSILVWVNTRTGVYHYPGSRWYQHTAEGKLMPESQARAEGDRPAENGQ
jgi:hypothetical protein